MSKLHIIDYIYRYFVFFGNRGYTLGHTLCRNRGILCRNKGYTLQNRGYIHFVEIGGIFYANRSIATVQKYWIHFAKIGETVYRNRAWGTLCKVIAHFCACAHSSTCVVRCKMASSSGAAGRGSASTSSRKGLLQCNR